MTCVRDCFKTVKHFSETMLMNRIEYNLKSWFDWNFLKIGGWNDVFPPTIGLDYSDLSVLRISNDRSYPAGTVYEGVRKDWIWETNVDYTALDSNNYNPTSPAVIYVDGVPTIPEFINYSQGKVKFASPISPTSIVTAEYSYRNVQVSIADDNPWWTELQYRSFKQDDPHFSQSEDGSWSIGTHHRIQMPSVIIECVPRAVSTPYQLGDGAAWVQQDVLVHVLSDNRRSRNDLVDIFRGQFDNNFYLFDNDKIASNQDYGLDHNGDIVNSSLNHQYFTDPDNDYIWQNSRIVRTEVAEVEAINSRLFEGIVRMTLEFILED